MMTEFNFLLNYHFKAQNHCIVPHRNMHMVYAGFERHFLNVHLLLNEPAQ